MWRFGKLTLKTKSGHDDNFVVTGGAAGCYKDIAGTMTIIMLPAFSAPMASHFVNKKNWVAASNDKGDIMTTLVFNECQAAGSRFI